MSALDTTLLALRTVRDAGSLPSLSLAAVVALAVVLLVGLGPRKRHRGGLVAALPALVVGASILSGGAEAARVAAGATPALTMAQRTDMLALALVRAAGFFAFGALAAGALFGVAALIVASSGRVRSGWKDARRVVALVVGLVAMLVTAWWLAEHGRAAACIGAGPCAAGVVAVVLAARGRGSADDGERRAAAEAMARAMTLAAGAVACFAAGRGLLSSVGLGDDGPSPASWAPVVAQSHARFVHEVVGVAAFVVPVIVAAAVARPVRARASLSLAGRDAAFTALATVLAVAAQLGLRGPAAALVGLALTATPRGFDLPVVPPDADCRALVEDDVVFLGTDRISRGAQDVGAAALLDDPAACATFAAKQLPGTTDVWLATDGRTTFGRLGCLLGALAPVRAGALAPVSSGRRRYSRGAALPVSPCTVRWVGRGEDGSPVCGGVVLDHPRCYAYETPADEERVEPEKSLEVVATDAAVFHLRSMFGEAVLSDTAVPRAAGHDARGHDGFPGLEKAIAEQWRAWGQHRDPADRKRDFARLHLSREAPIREVLATIDAVRSVERDMAFPDGVHPVPAFDVSVSLPVTRTRPPPIEELSADAPGPSVRLELSPRDADSANGRILGEHLGALRACAARARHLPTAIRLDFGVDLEGFAYQVYASAPPGIPSGAPIEPSLRACLARAMDAIPLAFDARHGPVELTLWLDGSGPPAAPRDHGAKPQ